MRHLNLDTEQAEILLDAADTAVRFLMHRAKRLDPEGIVSGAAKLQAAKLQNVKDQLSRPPVEALADLHPMQRGPLIAAAKILAGDYQDPLKELAFREIRAIMLNPAHRDAPVQFEAARDE